MNHATLQNARQLLQFNKAFTTLQLVIFTLVVAGSWWTIRTRNFRPTLPAVNDEPRVVSPLYDYPFVVSDQQLSLVLEKLHPKFIQQPTKVNFVDHAIRMWDDDATFDDHSLSGKQMLSLLLDNRSFNKVWGSKLPLLQRSKRGVAVTTQQGRSSVSHVDHMMGTLAEIGIPLSFPVQTAQGRATVGSVLTNALLSFRLNQREYEWTALSAAFYVKDGRAWYSREGQRIDFNSLARRLMRQAQPLGVCYGQHRLYSLTILLRIDEQMRSEEVHETLLSESTRQQIHDYLLNTTKRLIHSQSVAGYWDGNWPDSNRPVPDPSTDPLSRRVLATGHVLEWWAMAPKSLHPPRANIVSASQWLVREITEMDPAKVEKNFTFLSHAGRALALWRRSLPAEFERQMKLTDTENQTHTNHAQNPI